MKEGREGKKKEQESENKVEEKDEASQGTGTQTTGNHGPPSRGSQT